MSQANVEVVRRLFDALERNDTAAVLALYDADVEWDFSGSPLATTLEHTIYRGHEGLRLWWREFGVVWESYEDSSREITDAGDHYVISAVTSRGRGRASGVEVEYSQHGLWTVRDGKILRVAWLRTRDEALEAVGLAE